MTNETVEVKDIELHSRADDAPARREVEAAEEAEQVQPDPPCPGCKQAPCAKVYEACRSKYMDVDMVTAASMAAGDAIRRERSRIAAIKAAWGYGPGDGIRTGYSGIVGQRWDGRVRR